MDNLRRVLNILHDKSNICDNALLSFDAEKAFDRIEWQVLFKTMERMVFGEKFMKWVRILYANPSAEILTNEQYPPLSGFTGEHARAAALSLAFHPSDRTVGYGNSQSYMYFRYYNWLLRTPHFIVRR